MFSAAMPQKIDPKTKENSIGKTSIQNTYYLLITRQLQEKPLHSHLRCHKIEL
jgi:hypothetical protein